MYMCTCEFQKYVEFLNPSIIHSLGLWRNFAILFANWIFVGHRAYYVVMHDQETYFFFFNTLKEMCIDQFKIGLLKKYSTMWSELKLNRVDFVSGFVRFILCCWARMMDT